MRSSTKKAIVNGLFIRSWWVYTFCIVCFLGYNHFVNNRKNEIRALQNRLFFFEKQKNMAFQIKEDLYQQICSQSDPAWIELVLMKQLGVVPDGYLKIHFKKD